MTFSGLVSSRLIAGKGGCASRLGLPASGRGLHAVVSVRAGHCAGGGWLE